MPTTPPVTPPAPLQYTGLSLTNNAAIEAGWIAPGEQIDGEAGNFILSKINDLLDEWSAQKLYAYAMQFQLYTLTPGLNPTEIGPDPAPNGFVISQRPMRLESAAIVIPAGNNNNTDIPIYLGDADWWAAQAIKDMQSQIPVGVYYQPDYPNGKLFFWPVPDQNYQVRLEMWGIISQFSGITQTFSMPPAYRKAITLSVAEELGGPLSDRPQLAKSAAAARAAIRQNNDASPRICTAGSGMPAPSPSSGRGRPDFDFLSGKPW